MKSKFQMEEFLEVILEKNPDTMTLEEMRKYYWQMVIFLAGIIYGVELKREEILKVL